MTGMYAQRFGKSGMARGLPIPDDHPTMVEFVDRNAGRPFFLYFSPFAVHSKVKPTPQHYPNRIPGGDETAYEGAVVAVGFFRPHVPLYASQKWFDLYPEGSLILPPIKRDDRRDTPRLSWYTHWSLPEPRLKIIEEHGQLKNKVRAYLACVSFVDAQVGRVLDVLEASGRQDETIVVCWSDHGYHLGEKDC